MFELRLQGWSADEIPRRLGVLDKLDADSRLHLVRLVFWPD